MSYAKLIGVGDDVSGEKIVIGLNAQGLACTGMSKSKEGENKVIKFDLADGDAADYRNAKTHAELLIMFSEALERAGVYIVGPKSQMYSSKGKPQIQDPGGMIAILGMDELGEPVIHAQASLTQPPPSSPPYGSLEWAKLILP
ncbi:hypothetical protein ABHN98_21250 [Pseudomonas syringae]|jgi:hypothetical protein